LEAHPTVKPVDMIVDAIMDCSKRGGLVADGFAGSGATLIAADRSGRVGAGIEIDPAYVDLIVRRLEKETGELAIHGDLFDSFQTVKKERL
jgi:DNA modification methylase